MVLNDSRTPEQVELEKRMKMAEEIGALKMALQKVSEAAATLITIHMVRVEHGGNPSPGQWAEFEAEIRAFGRLDLIEDKGCCFHIASDTSVYCWCKCHPHGGLQGKG